jgi:FlaA1/EpsC-like NDP-sugar epimerase
VTSFTPAELETLLNRPTRRLLSAADRRAFEGRSVLVTGAGGSIGSELARQLAGCAPSRLVLLEQSEYNLFRIEQEIAERFPQVKLEPILADVTRAAFVRRACYATQPDVIYHAAAYKHVTMTERAVCAAALVNILGTANVVEAAKDLGARFVLISSDKAAAPSSVMGATKRVAEMIVSRTAAGTFAPTIVRFGNVLGSSGSVLPIMRERIRAGKPIAITDPRATRFFMTADEAVSLVMKADLLEHDGDTYWLDMGEPVRIADLANRLLDLEQRLGFARVPIEIVGLRPGEKLHEQLTDQKTGMQRTTHARIWAAAAGSARPQIVGDLVKRLRRRITQGDPAAILDDLMRLVPGFRASDQAWAAANVDPFAELELPAPEASIA